MTVSRSGRPLASLVVAACTIVAMVGVGSATAAPRQKSSGNTLLIGQINTETNPSLPGSKATENRQTVAAWASMVNAAGGINGMKVKVIVVDDGNDPAKSSSGMKKLLDAGVVAIVSPNGSLPSVWQPLADAAGVPVIGGGCYTLSQINDQNYYCVTTTAILDGLKAQVKYAADQGAKSFGATYASDIPAAAAAAPLFKSLATANGLTWTESVGLTSTQPDYTAACVTFKQSNTTDVGIEGAPQPMTPLARDCARQNYFPKYTSGDAQIGQNAILNDPNIHEVIAATYSFPYLLTKGLNAEQTKSLQQYQAAMKKYAPKVLKSDNKQFSTTWWTGAVAFGVAAQKGVPKGTQPTAALIKQGLNSFSGETLGGLAPNPITFTAGQDHPHNSCWWGMVLKNHKLSAPDGMKTTCTP